MKDHEIVGHALAAVLPKYDRSWFRVPHLLQLNLILLVPLMSSAVAGYDGMYSCGGFLTLLLRQFSSTLTCIPQAR
jgi:fructose-specific phosphotransferase system IIC component